jgi:hypothetical protein
MLTVIDPRPPVKPGTPRRRPYAPPETLYTLHVRPGEDDSFGVLQIVHGRDDVTYYLWPVRADFGLGWRLDKLGEVLPGEDTTYHVHLDPLAEGGPRCACECKGWLRWGRCKHVKALVGLHRDGLLPVAHQPAPSLPTLTAADAA